jgi:hypothetical protein
VKNELDLGFGSVIHLGCCWGMLGYPPASHQAYVASIIFLFFFIFLNVISFEFLI